MLFTTKTQNRCWPHILFSVGCKQHALLGGKRSFFLKKKKKEPPSSVDLLNFFCFIKLNVDKKNTVASTADRGSCNTVTPRLGPLLWVYQYSIPHVENSISVCTPSDCFWEQTFLVTLEWRVKEKGLKAVRARCVCDSFQHVEGGNETRSGSGL